MTAYSTDFFQWTQETAERIKQGRFHGLELDALADEVESLGKRDRWGVINRLNIILVHLLKLQHQPGRAARSWRLSIAEQQEALALIFEESLSLRAQLPELVPKAYQLARTKAARETRLDRESFGQTCPYTIGGILESA